MRNARSRTRPAFLLPLCLLALLARPAAAQSGAQTASGGTKTAAAPSKLAPGTLFTPEQIASLLPATVYFQGRTAPLQLRNAVGVNLGGDQIVWASLVDSSGYSSAVQERYQFYLVTEGPLRFGDATLPAGAYGGGFVGDHFLLMDLGGHTVAQGALQTDAGLQRPRPLQLQAQGSSGVRLYLGRRWALLQGGGSRP